MILHVLIVDDNMIRLEPSGGFVEVLAKELETSQAFRDANQNAGSPFPEREPGIEVTAHGYESKLHPPKPLGAHREVHLRLHLCHETTGEFDDPVNLLNTHFVAVVVSDLRLSSNPSGDRGGFFFLKHVEKHWPDVQTILYSGNLEKPPDFPDAFFVRKAASFGNIELAKKIVAGMTAFLRKESIQRFARALRETSPEDPAPILYRSDALGVVLRRIYDLAKNSFAKPVPGRNPPKLLLDGETGTGKSRLARLLYRASGRTGEFLKVTCTEYQAEDRLAPTLFGYEKGAFTGALTRRDGLVSKAQDGMLLLDDLHFINTANSKSLHHFLDTCSYAPWSGEDAPFQSNAALIFTVETPLWQAILEKKPSSLPESFIARVYMDQVIQIPPIAERPEDFICLFDHHWRSRQPTDDRELPAEVMTYLLESGAHKRAARGIEGIAHYLFDSCNGRLKIDVKHVDGCLRQRGLLPPVPVLTAPGASDRGAVGPMKPEWDGRVQELARAALREKLGKGGGDIEGVLQKMFEEIFPKVWRQFLDLKTNYPVFDEEMFQDFFRYYALLDSRGEVAHAAKQLGIKRPAYSAWFGSREDKYLSKQEP